MVFLQTETYLNVELKSTTIIVFRLPKFVYDGNGAPYHTVPAATPLQGGNVVVHLQ